MELYNLFRIWRILLEIVDKHRILGTLDLIKYELESLLSLVVKRTVFLQIDLMYPVLLHLNYLT